MATTQSSDSDDATNSFLGYLFQIRFALLGGLRLRDPSENVAIEFLDDVRFASIDGTVSQLYQLKHSVEKKASLGAKSENLWKTIGNWSQKVDDQLIDLNATTLFLTTTGKLSSHSPLGNLRLHGRSESKALDELTRAATSSSNEVVRRSSAKFFSLSKSLQQAMMEQIIVIDSTVNIAEAATEIENVLAVSSRPEDLIEHRQHLEGWFFDRAIRSLLEIDNRTISAQEIRNHSITIRDRLVSDHLPGLPIASDIPSDELSYDDPRIFVEQLRLIKARSARIRRAQTEHFQALTKRSEWSREGKLAIEELPKFDSHLIGEWQIRHESACINCENANEHAELNEAERVYQWVEEQAPSSSQLYIRNSFSEPFLIRGSFHMLSDRMAVGWHPRYIELLQRERSSVKEDVS